eukprot:11652550-Karenia_brevis.AAC.1
MATACVGKDTCARARRRWVRGMNTESGALQALNRPPVTLELEPAGTPELELDAPDGADCSAKLLCIAVINIGFKKATKTRARLSAKHT